MVDLGLRDESIQKRKVTIGRDLEGETDFEGGDLPSQHRTSWVQFGLGQVPTELEHVAAGPGNEMPGWGWGLPLSFQLVPTLSPRYSLDSRDHWINLL